VCLRAQRQSPIITDKRFQNFLLEIDGKVTFPFDATEDITYRMLLSTSLNRCGGNDRIRMRFETFVDIL